MHISVEFPYLGGREFARTRCVVRCTFLRGTLARPACVCRDEANRFGPEKLAFDNGYFRRLK
jgi:hypothetical protein